MGDYDAGRDKRKATRRAYGVREREHYIRKRTEPQLDATLRAVRAAVATDTARDLATEAALRRNAAQRQPGPSPYTGWMG